MPHLLYCGELIDRNLREDTSHAHFKSETNMKVSTFSSLPIESTLKGLAFIMKIHNARLLYYITGGIGKMFIYHNLEMLLKIQGTHFGCIHNTDVKESRESREERKKRERKKRNKERKKNRSTLRK